MDNIYVIIFIVLSLLIYNLISYIQVNKKQKIILNSNNIYLSKNKKNFVSSYINKIESKFKNESSSYSLYIKDSMFVFKLYGYLLNDRIIIYGKHNIPNYSIIVNDNTQDTYCITSSKDYVIKIN